jgi:predicted choloylglycine hydrolase
VSSLRDTVARALRGRRGRPREPGGPPRAIPFTFVAIAEDQPADAFQARFDESWDAYRAWYLQAGDAARPSYVECRAAIRTHMPELLATYERVVELGGGGDLAARMLSLWCPPSYLSGCTQAVLFRPEPVLIRNYDYDLHRIEGAIVRTGYTGRAVIGMSDCLWGLLDGVNDQGLAVSSRSAAARRSARASASRWSSAICWRRAVTWTRRPRRSAGCPCTWRTT